MADNTAPSSIGIDDPARVRHLICAAQLARHASIASGKPGSAQGAT
jgi:hypothetical protein